MPRSRPSSTARTIALAPKRSRTSSSAASSAPARRRSSGSSSWSSQCSRLLRVTPTSVSPLASISGVAAASRARAVTRIVLRLAGRLRQRVRAGRAREVVEAQAQDDGATDPPALAQPAAQAVDQPDERRVDRRPRLRPPADRALRPDRAAPDADPHPPRIAVVGEGVELAPGGAAEQRDELVLVQPRGLRDGRDPVGVQLARGDRADAPQPLDRQRVQEGELLAGGHLEQAVGLRHGARHLGQVLRGGDPDGDRQARPRRAPAA